MDHDPPPGEATCCNPPILQGDDSRFQSLRDAKVPYTNKRSIDISSIMEYNVVVDELVAANNLSVTPHDFYAYFQEHPDEIPDGIHPNRIGYESMANLWFLALTRLKSSLSEEPLLKSTSTPVWQWYDRIVFAQGSTLPLIY